MGDGPHGRQLADPDDQYNLSDENLQLLLQGSPYADQVDPDLPPLPPDYDTDPGNDPRDTFGKDFQAPDPTKGPFSDGLRDIINQRELDNNASIVDDVALAELASQFHNPGTSGSAARQVTDTTAVQAQQSAIQQTLDASLAHIADGFERMNADLDRLRSEGLDEIEAAREAVMAELAGVREDFATQSDDVDASIIASIEGTRGAISSDSEGILRDLEAQGASTTGVQEAVTRGQAQAANQGQIQADLVDRLQEINANYLQRNEQTTANIAQGASGDLESNFASALSSVAQDRADKNFQVQEGARQALLQLIMNPPKKTVGGSKGTSSSGWSVEETNAAKALAAAGVPADRISLAINTGNLNSLADSHLFPDTADGNLLADVIASDPEAAGPILAATLEGLIEDGTSVDFAEKILRAS